MSPTDSLPTTPHLQPNLPKPQDILVPYLITEIEEYLAEAMERLNAKSKTERLKSRFKKLWWIMTPITIFKSTNENSLRPHSYLWYKVRDRWQQWATNPYNLHPIWHLFIMILLLFWIVGSSLLSWFEAGADTGTVAVARLCRGFLGSVPPMIQFLLFLYPPLFVQF
ncbi:hypothetical protein COCMIDRAFT_5471 [Bipolaris oryzae ATCC 44560]|uniref:Uncharacterized protein n=1 Tax=Bipolaris oryzae ATCC 44560 TaxID=930090 RepID=W6Z5M4_COCMI|nr:uncharacterized protein COCMIDRAFT_5471 [Bipolaris oryzae ATCC 44560]EUC45265.1 hypothetical protein COCMIDRAFT_5471 [Bipolaris oryzae ATCC 44560]